MLKKAKVTCCRVENADFTKCDVSKYSNVEYILVDPSCSGSGERILSSLFIRVGGGVLGTDAIGALWLLLIALQIYFIIPYFMFYSTFFSV